MDQHRFDADPDPIPNFNVDADPDPDPDWHPNNGGPHADPTPSFTHIENHYFFLLLVTALPFYNVLSFSSVSNVSYVLSIFDKFS